MKKFIDRSDSIVKVDHGSIRKSNSMFQWQKAVSDFEKLQSLDSSRLKKILNKCIPREFLVYFSGSPINNSFAYFFNVSTDKIYKKTGVNFNKFAFSLLTFALLMMTFAVYFAYPSVVVNAFSMLKK